MARSSIAASSIDGPTAAQWPLAEDHGLYRERRRVATDMRDRTTAECNWAGPTRLGTAKTAPQFNGSNGFVSVPYQASRLILRAVLRGAVGLYNVFGGAETRGLSVIAPPPAALIGVGVWCWAVASATWQVVIGTGTNGWQTIDSGITSSTGGQWKYLAITFDGSILSIFVDGALVKQATVTGYQPNPDTSLTIGANDGGTDDLWLGRIQNVGIYNYALASNRVAAHYNQVAYRVEPYSNLVTTDVLDSLGRITKETDPKGNVTYTIYHDGRTSDGFVDEVMSYPGWHEIGTSGTYTTTGPIDVTREYRPAPGAPAGQQTVYDETLSFTAIENTAVPSGTETINGGDIQTLSRSITNNAGQLVEDDAFSSLSGVTYSPATVQLAGAVAATHNTTNGNETVTLYGYDDQGRLSRTVDPNGTIGRTVYDPFGRVVSRWIGTDDSASGGWAPNNNGSPSNMIDVEDDFYDTQTAPPTPTLTLSSDGKLQSANDLFCADSVCGRRQHATGSNPCFG